MAKNSFLAFSPSSTSSPASSTVIASAAAAAIVGAYYCGVWKKPKSGSSRFALPQLFSMEGDHADTDDASSCIYLDYNGTTPVHPLVLAAMLPFLTTHFGNPSSGHAFGLQPKLGVEQARQSILTNLLGTTSEPTSSLWFTACGTESDNLAIQLALQSTKSNSHESTPHIVTSNVEHPAIEVCLKALEADGKVDVTYVPVRADGRVVASDMIAAMTEKTVLVTLMLANNESGALQPVKQVAQECRKRGILMHTDAAQAAGKVSIELAAIGYPDLVTIVGHKLGAPKGIAALYVRDKCLFEHGRNLPDGCVLLYGGGQEFGRRGGTENVAYMAGLGKAAELAAMNLMKNGQHMEAMRSRLLSKLQSELGKDKIRVNGPSMEGARLPNTLSVGLKNIESGTLLDEVGAEVAASAGAACHSSGGDVSAILQAMQVPMEYARGTLRLSLGPSITIEEVDKAAAILCDAAKRQWASAKTEAVPPDMKSSTAQ